MDRLGWLLCGPIRFAKAPRCAHLAVVMFAIGALLAIARQENDKFRSLAQHRIDKQKPPGLTDDPVNGGKAKPSSGAHLPGFGGEKGFKNPRQILPRDASSGIADRNHRVNPWRNLLCPACQRCLESFTARADRQSAPAGHGITGIDRKINNDLVKLPRINPHRPNIATMVHF